MRKSSSQIKKFLAVLCTFSCLSLLAGERRADLSCSRQVIRILPEISLKDMPPVDQIIFLHIPKTAGTNVDAIAKALSQNGERKNFHYQRLSVPRIQGRSPILMTTNWIGGLQQMEDDPHLLDKLPQPFFLTGHFPYGVHQFFSRPSKYVALIRHPLERELSSANFDYQRGYIDADEFESYLLEKMIDNPQVRLIAGREAMTGLCTEETLKKAKKNIEEHFLLAAPSEDVDTFIQVLAGMQGWGPVAYSPMQITREKVMPALSDSLTSILREKHKWDIALYEWVKTRWNSWKEQAALSSLPLSSEQKVLTLLPDYSSTNQAVFLSVSEINERNQQHSADELLENNQKM
ncbi:MAG: hypothetical protein JWO53_917 [Chlamydiia bacterium]|nr:hypothetical protein [Chlamydiia bacterium]